MSIKALKHNCSCCGYNTNIKRDFNKHLLTVKHITNKEQNKTIEQINNELNYECKICCKKFMSQSGLWKHKKTCIEEPKKVEQTPQPPTTVITNKNMKEYFEENKDFFINMVIDELKNNCGVLENRVVPYNSSNERREPTVPRTPPFSNENNEKKEIYPNTLNIVELIENNPITNLSNTYQNKLINKIKENFNNDEQHFFIANFYCYLNCNETDFVIDLNNVWMWLGFVNKENAKRLLEKHFKPEIDYKISLLQTEKRPNEEKGGQNKETILLTVETFKLYCIKAGTEKASLIHKYYIKLEKILQEVIKEECNEFKLQLENHKIQNIIEKELLREKTIIEHIQDNTECIYIGIIDDTNENKEQLLKFGQTNNLKKRIEQHKKFFTNFCLIYAYVVENKITIENCIKNEKKLQNYRRSLVINDVNQTELLAYDKLTITKLDEIIKTIIITNEYSAKKIKKLLEENKELKMKLNIE